MLLITRGRFNLSVLTLGLIGLLSLTALPTSGQIELQCPNELLTISNGTITFSPISEGSGPVDASYDPGAAGGWYALANGFVDAVRPGSLPFGELSTFCCMPGLLSNSFVHVRVYVRAY